MKPSILVLLLLQLHGADLNALNEVGPAAFMATAHYPCYYKEGVSVY